MEDRIGEENPVHVEHIFLYERFEEICPFYMSIGMTYKEFWEEDVSLAKIYLKAWKLKQKREAEIIKWQLWEQGLYIYEAICDVSPILRAFSKAKKPLPYPEKPWGLDKMMEEDDDESKKEAQDKLKKEAEIYRAQVFFTNWAKATSNHFKKQEGGT